MPRHHRHHYLAVFAKVLHTHHAHTTGTAHTRPVVLYIKVRNRVVSVVSVVSVPAAQGFLGQAAITELSCPRGQVWTTRRRRRRYSDSRIDPRLGTSSGHYESRNDLIRDSEYRHSESRNVVPVNRPGSGLISRESGLKPAMQFRSF